ncbi:MAG TPA: sigma-70 family RNA polymerase sigma factor [Solirubrobacteraceae bacterium]|nr:sigma-70 family RNA polymerase sigma factor [Solirubrobacteraceae bacterium]
MTHSAPSCSEHELVAAVRRGDERAFEVLYSRYRRRIASYIYGMVGDHGRAEDITQEVFISAFRRLRKTDQPILFKPWLYEVAKNACIDEFRRARRGQEVPLERDDEIVGANPRLMALAPTPETAIESKQKLADLRGAFRGLSESHHKVIVLRELEGLSYAQIGEQLGMSQTVVESTLFRARRRLGEEYEELISGRRCQRVRAVIDEGETLTARSLGIKERRLIARHLAHCQPCRRHARLAGVDDSLLEQPTLVGKIAALLPIPIWLRSRLGGGGSTSPSRLAQSAQVAAANPAAFGAMARATAAAMTLVVAGAGTGIVTFGTNTAHHTPTGQAPLHRAAALDSSAGRPITAARRIVRQPKSAAASAHTSSARSTVVPEKQAVSRAATQLIGRSRGAAGAGKAAEQRPGVSGSSAGARMVGGSAGGSGRTGAGGALHGTSGVVVAGAGAGGLPKLPGLSLPALTKPGVSSVQNLVTAGTATESGR